jgi:hypothetical protein
MEFLDQLDKDQLFNEGCTIELDSLISLLLWQVCQSV